MSEGARDYHRHGVSAFEASEQRLLGAFEMSSRNGSEGSYPYRTPEQGGLQHNALDLGDAEPEANDSGEAVLARVLQLPPPEPVPPADETSGNIAIPTALQVDEVKEILSSPEHKDMHSRIGSLLAYAWKATHIERPLPPELLFKATDNPADWYQAHKNRVEEYIIERKEIASIYDQTEVYAASPFLRNAAEINEIAWNRHMGDEGMRLQLSARLIVLEAMQS